MKILLVLTSLFLSITFAMSQSPKPHDKEQIDDWDYNSTIPTFEMGNMQIKSMSAPTMMKRVASDSIGFSVGGAKDANNFYKNIDNNYLPKIDSITYEGVFYDHYFDTRSKQSCKNLFCPDYSTAIRKNIYTDKDEHFITVGLNSNIKKSDFKRKKLNIVVVLDISGSMGSAFNQYYYDKGKKINIEESQTSKMKIANETIVNMIDHLSLHDRLGVVLFDNRSYRAKPLSLIKTTNISAIKNHILEIKQRGGTNWSAGYKEGLRLFDNLSHDNSYENRIIFITDAMPNRGELAKEKLFGMIKEASSHKIYTSVIGVGVDFNNDLVEYISKTRGANYFSVHSAKEFKKRLNKEFDYLVTPLVFDLKLEIASSSYSIDSVYGAPKADTVTGTIFEVDTLFPSDSSDEGVKGGVILVKLKKQGDSEDIKIKVSYKDRDNNPYKVEKTIKFKSGNYTDNSGIKKAIALTDYVSLMKNWLLDTRAGCNDSLNYPYPPIHILQQRSLIYPPNRPIYPNIKTWERKSCPLVVSDGYKKLFSIFKNNFDSSFTKEYKTVEKLLNKPSQNKKDDWNTNR